MRTVTWQGSEREFARLQLAIEQNCDCVPGMAGLPPRVCAAHAMLSQQGALDHLLYVYRTRKTFIVREFYSCPRKSGNRSVVAERR